MISRPPSPGAGHGHTHARTSTGGHRRALTFVLVISSSIAIGEVIGAIITGALVLFADAAHMAADAAGIGLSLLAAWFAWPPRDRPAHLRLRQGGDPGRDGKFGAAAGHGRGDLH